MEPRLLILYIYDYLLIVQYLKTGDLTIKFSHSNYLLS
jgi:hypothetical protein